MHACLSWAVQRNDGLFINPFGYDQFRGNEEKTFGVGFGLVKVEHVTE